MQGLSARSVRDITPAAFFSCFGGSFLLRFYRAATISIIMSVHVQRLDQV